MYTSPSVTAIDNPNELTPQAVKLLSEREDYVTCHIRVPGDTERLPAITMENKFYSFFRALKDPQKTLGLLLKLSSRDNQVAVIPTNRGYSLWVYESDAIAASNSSGKQKIWEPTFSPADCWIISDQQPGYRACALKVPDLSDTVQGLTNGQKLYSLYRREQDAGTALKLAARLSKRGDEVVIVVGTSGYVVCIYEPAATTMS